MSGRPTLTGEIGGVLWMLVKVLGGFVLPLLAIGVAVILLLPQHPYVAIAVLSMVYLLGFCVALGWQTYKWRRKQWEQEQQLEQLERMGSDRSGQ